MSAFVLVFLFATAFVADGQLVLSAYSYTAVEGSNIIVNCTHGAGAQVSLSGLTSTVFSQLPDPFNTTIFTIQNVSRLDNNKQFTCTQPTVTPSPPAQLTVWYITPVPQFPLNLVVISTPGLYYLNITVTANPFVIPGNITVLPPPGVTFPAQFMLDSVVNDTGTAYVMLDRFLLPQYAGNYSITIRHPAVGTTVIQFSLSVVYTPRYAYNDTSSNATFNVYFQLGSTGNVSCAATGVPQPSIVGYGPSFNTATNLYTFPKFSPSDVGSYVCVAINTVGSNTITYNVASSTGVPSTMSSGVFSVCILILAVVLLV